MAHLETIAETDESVACVFMADLWGPASDARMHEICDAIDLWLCNNDSQQLYEYLKKLALSEPDPGKRRHFKQLVELKSK
jgi:hypothetical protein